MDDNEELLLEIAQFVYNRTNDWGKVDKALTGFSRGLSTTDTHTLVMMCAVNEWLKVLQWARSTPNPYPWENWTLIRAVARLCSFTIFKWMIDNGCPVYSRDLIDVIVHRRSSEFLDYMYDCQIPHPELYIPKFGGGRGCKKWYAEHGENWRNGIFRCPIKPAK